MLVSYLVVLWAQSTARDYKRAERKLHSISKSFTSQVIIPQVFFFFSFLKCFRLFIFRGHSTRESESSMVTYFIRACSLCRCIFVLPLQHFSSSTRAALCSGCVRVPSMHNSTCTLFSSMRNPNMTLFTYTFVTTKLKLRSDHLHSNAVYVHKIHPSVKK